MPERFSQSANSVFTTQAWVPGQAGEGVERGPLIFIRAMMVMET